MLDNPYSDTERITTRFGNPFNAVSIGTETRRSGGAAASGQGAATATGAKEPARNAPCPCGSGKKYKLCHGRPGAN